MTRTARTSRALIVALVLAAVVGCDRATKSLAVHTLGDGERRSYLADTVRLQYVENRGAFLGLGRDLPASARFWLLLVGTGVLLAAATFMMMRAPRQAKAEAF